MSRYAEKTSVPADRSRAEIERELIRYGASVVFQFKARRIRLDLPMPTEREVGTTQKAEQAMRQRWRALLLVIKAKLEAVESGISTLEHEFLANIVTENGRTIGDVVVPRLTEAIESGRLLPEKAGQ